MNRLWEGGGWVWLRWNGHCDLLDHQCGYSQTQGDAFQLYYEGATGRESCGTLTALLLPAVQSVHGKLGPSYNPRSITRTSLVCERRKARGAEKLSVPSRTCWPGINPVQKDWKKPSTRANIENGARQHSTLAVFFRYAGMLS